MVVPVNMSELLPNVITVAFWIYLGCFFIMRDELFNRIIRLLCSVTFVLAAAFNMSINMAMGNPWKSSFLVIVFGIINVGIFSSLMVLDLRRY